jgi:hypothetical protein
LSATVPASFGRGGPAGLALGFGLRPAPGLGLPLGDAVGLDGGGLDDVDPHVVGSGSPAQPAKAPAATPAETSRKWRRETMSPILTRRRRGMPHREIGDVL